MMAPLAVAPLAVAPLAVAPLAVAPLGKVDWQIILAAFELGATFHGSTGQLVRQGGSRPTSPSTSTLQQHFGKVWLFRSFKPFIFLLNIKRHGRAADTWELHILQTVKFPEIVYYPFLSF